MFVMNTHNDELMDNASARARHAQRASRGGGAGSFWVHRCPAGDMEVSCLRVAGNRMLFPLRILRC